MTVQWWQFASLDFLHTGSRVICNPPPTNTDDDWLLLLDKADVGKFQDKLIEEGFELGGSCQGYLIDADSFVEDGKTSFFNSYKKDSLNLLVTISPRYFKEFKHATALAKALNLMDKAQRIMLFEAIVHNTWPEVLEE